MKRLIDTKKETTFKNWIIQHDPKCKWNFNDPQVLKSQFVNVVSESGDIDLRTIYDVMFAVEDSGLTINQNNKFLKEVY